MIELLGAAVDAALTREQQIAFVCCYFGLLICAVSVIASKAAGHEEEKEEPVGISDLANLF